MHETREISALLHLIDDPDDDVFTTVSDKIISLGKQIIPNLENLWETTPDENVQERIEMLIHRLHFSELQNDFMQWSKDPEADLFAGAMMIGRYQYPDIAINSSYQELEKIRRNIWLELNSFLTPLEQANVVNSILFNYYRLKGTEVTYVQPDEFLIHKVMESKKGNTIGNALLYLTLCRLLDINIHMVNIPRQCILACYDDALLKESRPNYATNIQFYIDPASGQIFTQKDVENYFKRISVPPTPSYFKPLSNKQIIQLSLEEFSKCFESEKDAYKKREILSLAEYLNV